MAQVEGSGTAFAIPGLNKNALLRLYASTDSRYVEEGNTVAADGVTKALAPSNAAPFTIPDKKAGRVDVNNFMFAPFKTCRIETNDHFNFASKHSKLNAFNPRFQY
jgi:hypothetical protein